MKALILFILFFLYITTFIFADDTTVHRQFSFRKFNSNLFQKELATDTTNNFFLKDVLFNSFSTPVASVGNVSSPVFSLSPGTFFHSGFEVLPNYYYDYFFLEPEVYHLSKAITSLKFSLGSKREQGIAFFHSQNIGERLNIFSRSQNFRSDGFYRNQTSRSNCFEIGFSLTSKNNRIFTNSNLSVGSIYNRENGGLADSVIFNDVTIDKSLLDVNLLQSSNRFRKNSWKISNRFFMKDYGLILADSLSYKFSLYHNFTFEEIKRNYLDSISDDFYGEGNYSSLSSTDFIYNRNIENKIGAFYGNTFNYLNVWVSNPINYVSTFFQRINNPGLDVNVEALKKIKLVSARFSFKYYLNNYNKGDYNLNWELVKFFNDGRFNLGLNANLLRSSPFLFFNRFYSNRNDWNNDFDSEKFLKLGITSNYRKYLFLEIDFYSIKSLILFSEFNIPKQLTNEMINYGKISLSSNFKSKRFSSYSTLVFQKPFNNSFDLNFPTFFMKEKLRILFSSFKKNLRSGIGFDIIYATSTNGWGYLPSLSVFTFNDNLSVLGYPRIDFVYDFKVKNLEGYFRVDNILSGFTEDLYYTLDRYPMADRIIRLGIIWTFIDDKFIEKKQ
jgi:hypothetical protein